MSDLEQLAELVATHNSLAGKITSVIGRPALMGHVGEYIASRIFGIRLEQAATAKSIDGVFTEGPLVGRSVNVKWYGKLEGVLDLKPDLPPEFYLVMTGPRSAAMSSRGQVRPWVIDYVFLYDAANILSALRQRGVKIGIASSVKREYWEQAEIYPHQRLQSLVLSPEQRRQLSLFGSQGAERDATVSG